MLQAVGNAGECIFIVKPNIIKMGGSWCPRRFPGFTNLSVCGKDVESWPQYLRFYYKFFSNQPVRKRWVERSLSHPLCRLKPKQINESVLRPLRIPQKLAWGEKRKWENEKTGSGLLREEWIKQQNYERERERQGVREGRKARGMERGGKINTGG